MQIKKITSIKSYKSFVDYEWSAFCKDRAGAEIVLNPFNLFFGENGSGKSSICEILKDLSQHTSFLGTLPSLSKIEVKDNDGKKSTKKCESGIWDSKLDKNSILFFDKEFVDANVHTNGTRSNEKNKHSQNSGELIIQLDATANDFKSKIKIKEKEVEDFNSSNNAKLTQDFSIKDKELYSKYKIITDKEKKTLIEEHKKIFDKGKNEEKRLESLIVHSAKISSIICPTQVSLEKVLSNIETYQEIFTRKVEEETEKETAETIRNHISMHRSFVEKGLEIINQTDDKDKCPFCLQSLTDAQDTIKAYFDFFNEEYKRQKQKLIDDIDSLKKELEEIKNEIKGLPTRISDLFDSLEKIGTDFSIQDLYDLKSKEEIKKSLEELNQIPSQFSSLQKKLDGLKNIDNTPIDFRADYEAIMSIVSFTSKKLEQINQLVKKADENIFQFKNKYSDSHTIHKELDFEKEKIQAAFTIINFFEKDILPKIKEWSDLNNQKTTLAKSLTDLKTARDQYLTNKAPEIVLDKMTAILLRFNLSFELKGNPINRPTSEFPFSFKVIDESGKERDIKTGLSEGERQLVSLAFFFALNEKVQDKDKKVIVFDDPITSLDSANLKILADIIYEQKEKKVFSQVFVFTHHPLFHKYLAKLGVNKFGVLKNHASFGGSFIYSDPGFDTTEMLKNCQQDLLQHAQKQTLNVEYIALQYGHLLRLSIERFIKNELLLWGADNFETVVSGLKDGQSKIKKLDSKDLEVIEKIYKYCNHSNLLHADKEATSAMSELLNHIKRYVKLIDKITS